MHPNLLLRKGLVQNVQLITDTIQDNLLISKFFNNPIDPNRSFCLIYLSYMADKEVIHDDIIRPILQYRGKPPQGRIEDVLGDSLLVAGEYKQSNIIQEITSEIMYGRSALLLDGYDQAWLIETTMRVSRTSTEPDAETALRGPREGFTESLAQNLSMIRKRVITPHLKIEYLIMGKDTNTKTCICYIDHLIDPNLITMVRERVSKINTMDGVLDSYIVLEKIMDKKYSPFNTIGQTERPDTFVAKLLEGKVGLLVDGSPVAITMPYLFGENFQATDDYYVPFYFASISRVLRLLAFVVSVFTPGLYVAITTRHLEIIPSSLFLSIAHAHQEVPLPTIIECLVMLIVFEIIREAGMRTPTSIGNAISIVGAIVIGQAAVQARLISAPMVIVVSVTAIAGLVNTKMKSSSISFRFMILFLAGILGIYGIAIGFCLIIIHLVNIRSFTVDYTERYTPIKLKNIKSNILRFPPDDIHTKE